MTSYPPSDVRSRPFKQVDVFTAAPYLGNPLAVVLDGGGLDEQAMRRFAAWTNLSETTFLLPPTDPTADYRVRIFTPSEELPFAGHPTLGSCHAWLQAGGKPRDPEFIVQECTVGLVRIRREELAGGRQRFAFAAPPLKRSAPSPAYLSQVAAALGLKAVQIRAAQVLDNGPVWFGLLLDKPETVLALTPDYQSLKRLNAMVGIAAFYDVEEAAPLIGRANREAQAFAQSTPDVTNFMPDAEVRAFAEPFEDPVTGSFNAALAQWLMQDGMVPDSYRASQGVCMGRAGQVHITRDPAGQVWVGGESVTCISGEVTL
ncbi:MAG: PhzF family phenazine biosynthesis protein [Comamonadaceae bacterium]|nr:MAG: PhzF family phenazine biosynthesis protein [Comamonadaceae bacterium]